MSVCVCLSLCVCRCVTLCDVCLCVVEVNVVEHRRTFILDKCEGIYVRDITTGDVRAVIGKNYMLTENEELWERHT